MRDWLQAVFTSKNMAAYSSGVQCENMRKVLLSFLQDGQATDDMHITALPLVVKLSHGLNLFADQVCAKLVKQGHMNE